MNTSIQNCMVAQSGGPTVAINASLAGVIKGAAGCYGTVYGSVNGILGILNEHYLNLSEIMEADDNALENIGAFFYIGGNDSMDTVLKLSEYAERIGSNVRIIGIPKTIDNDLMVTDHTPGFGSAAKYIASSLLEIAHDTFIYAVKSVTIVEIMGRDAGWLTAASALARNEYSDAPHLIYLPECNFDKDEFLTDVRALLEEHNNIIIAVSEGIHDAEGNYICAGESKEDTFGHSQLSGAGKSVL